MTKCASCGRTPKRTSEANRRYWALLAVLAEKLPVQGNYFSRTSWHEYFKEKLLGAKEIMLPNGKTRVMSESSADLDTKEFSEFMDKVEVWCAEHDIFLDE